MSDWQTQMAGLVQTAPEDRTNPFNLGVSALLTPFRHFLQNALVILSSFDAFRMEAFKLITAYFSFHSTRYRSKRRSFRFCTAPDCLLVSRSARERSAIPIVSANGRASVRERG